MNKYCYNFKIADIRLRILSETAAEVNKSFAVFEDSEGAFEKPDYIMYVRLTSGLNLPKGQCIYHGHGTSVFRTKENNYVRVLQELYADEKKYAVSFCDWKNKTITAEILRERKKHAENILEIFKCIPWETVLLHERRLMLHASYIYTPYGGIAFSGPSGIGKTTQAKLWCTYKEAKMLNGDKVVLHKKDKCWRGYGSPYAGSSSCYVNDDCELKYLFFLKQGTECSLRKLSLAESFKQIYAGITLNRWDAEYVRMACNLAEELAMDIPVYEFTCTPDESAVDFLQKKLKGGEICGFNK